MKTYHGSPCKLCGNTEKYISNQSCKRCTVDRSKHKLYDGTVNRYHTPEKTHARLVRWRKNNPEKVKEQRKRVLVYQAAYQAGRRVKKSQQTPSTANNQAIISIYEEARRMSQLTGIPHDVDHKIPICKGGLHHQDNLQILTASENRKKGGRL